MNKKDNFKNVYKRVILESVNIVRRRKGVFDLDVKEVKTEPVKDYETGEPMENKFYLCITYNNQYWKGPYTQRYSGVKKEDGEFTFSKRSESYRLMKQFRKIGVMNPFELEGKTITCEKKKLTHMSRSKKWYPIKIVGEDEEEE